MSDQFDNMDKTHLVSALSRTPVYRILLLANLIGQPFFNRFGKSYNLTLNEWRIMMVLSENPGTSISEICRRSGLHIMNVSRGIKGLERSGRVLKKVDPEDRRRSILDLSEEGMAVFLEIAPSGLDWADTVCAALDEGETKLFDSMLTKMIDHIQNQNRETS